MPFIQLERARIHYTDTQEGDQTLLFLHGFLWDGRLFDYQIAPLRSRFRCICPDFRGQGASEITDTGYDIDSLSTDIRQFIKALNIEPCHLVGLSMGGFVGLNLAIHHPALLSSLTLIGTTAAPEPLPNRLVNRMLVVLIRTFGLKPLLGAIESKLYGQHFRTAPDTQALRKALRRRLLGNDLRGTTSTIKAMSGRPSQREALGQITVPTLILAGDQDTAIPHHHSIQLADAITGAQLQIIDNGGHSLPLEQPDAVSRSLAAFLEQHTKHNRTSQGNKQKG